MAPNRRLGFAASGRYGEAQCHRHTNWFSNLLDKGFQLVQGLAGV